MVHSCYSSARIRNCRIRKNRRKVYSKIVVYKDRIEFRNVGSLYGENTIEKIKKPEMNVEVRNETLVKLIETLGGVIENRHTGIKTMIDEMKQAKLPEPVFKNEREDFVVNFYNGEYPELYPSELSESNTSNCTQVNAQVNAQVNRNQITEKDIMNFCKEAKSLKEIVTFFGYKNARGFREKYINVLLKENKLKQTVPDKPTSSKQKYITKEKDTII